MLGLNGGAEFSVALVNAGLLASWAVLPILLAAYLWQSAIVRRIRPEFSLRQSEASELDRAARLYDHVCRRLDLVAEGPQSFLAFCRSLFRPVLVLDPRAIEREDLEAQAGHLRATIVRLKQQPLLRLRTFIHRKSLQAALGRALAAYIVGFALLIVAARIPGQRAFGDELASGAGDLLAWDPLDASFFYANAGAAAFAAALAPLFYLVRRFRLRREFAVEFCAFRELAAADPSRLLDHTQAAEEGADDAASQSAPLAMDEPDSWFSVLGVSPSATIEEVRESYRRLIKQNHPDRMQDLSPVLRRLAEAETKRLNVAYRQALDALAERVNA